jgi:hypothetical protein
LTRHAVVVAGRGMAASNKKGRDTCPGRFHDFEFVQQTISFSCCEPVFPSYVTPRNLTLTDFLRRDDGN